MIEGFLELAIAVPHTEEHFHVKAGGGVLGHHGRPVKHGLKGQRASLVAKMVEVGSGDLGNNGFQFRACIGGYSPLHKAEVAWAYHSEFAGEPVLLFHPLYGCQPVIVLATRKLEIAPGACCAAATLDKHLEAALGVRESRLDAKKPRRP